VGNLLKKVRLPKEKKLGKKGGENGGKGNKEKTWEGKHSGNPKLPEKEVDIHGSDKTGGGTRGVGLSKIRGEWGGRNQRGEKNRSIWDCKIMGGGRGGKQRFNVIRG